MNEQRLIAKLPDQPIILNIGVNEKDTNARIVIIRDECSNLQITIEDLTDFGTTRIIHYDNEGNKTFEGN